MEVACKPDWQLILEYLKVILSWPAAALIIFIFLRKPVISLLARMKKVNAFGVSAELVEQLASQATPARGDDAHGTGIDLSVSKGAYSVENHAIFLVAGIANRTERQDQVVSWRLKFPSLDIELEPTAAPQNLMGGVPWWYSPLVNLPPNKFIQGSLFFRGAGILADRLPEEPLSGEIVAQTLHGERLVKNVEVYRLVTLQGRE